MTDLNLSPHMQKTIERAQALQKEIDEILGQSRRRHSPNWGGKRPNAGRHKKVLHAPRVGDVWKFYHPVIIGEERVCVEGYQHIELTVTKTSLGHIEFIDDKGLTYTLDLETGD